MHLHKIGIHIHVPTRGSIKCLVFCDESSDFLAGIFNIEILLILSMKIKTEVESALASSRMCISSSSMRAQKGMAGR